MKADLHVHTMYSKDGTTTMEELIDTAVARGLGCIAVTDHNVLEAYNQVKDNGRVIVIPAEEVSSVEGHIVGLGINKQIQDRMSIQETIDAIHEAGGYAIAVHPYRWWSGLGEANVLKYDFDGIEAKNSRSTPSSNRKSVKLSKRIGKPITAGSDAHSPKLIGAGYIEISDDVTTWQEAVAYIMSGQTKTAVSHNRSILETLHYGFKSIIQWMLRGFKKM